METLKEFIRALNPGRWAALIGAIVLLVLVVFIIGRCTRGDDVREARQGAAMEGARTESAIEAINEIGELHQRGEASDNELKEAHDAIRQADPADRDRVARYELCRLQHAPDCDRLL